MNKSIKLIKYINKGKNLDKDLDPIELFSLAKKNKIPLHYLKNIKEPRLNEEKKKYIEKEQELKELINTLSTKLSNKDYTIFKTIKPFPYTPADIDILIKEKKDLKEIIKKLGEEIRLLEKEKENNEVTLYSEKHGLNIDLYLEINVADFIYLNKKHLLRHRAKRDGLWTLSPVAELVAVAAHSLYKEQLYTLNEFYTFLGYRNHIKEATRIAEKTKTKKAFKEVLETTYSILKELGMEKKLKNKLDIDLNKREIAPKLPHRFSFNTLTRCSLEKLRDRKALSSIPSTLSNFLYPSFYKKAIRHRNRESY